jgi:hypothetical protein
MDSCLISSKLQGFAASASCSGDTRFFHSLRSTAVFTVISVFFELVFGMALALIMNKAIKESAGVRTTALIPWRFRPPVRAHVELHVRRQQRGSGQDIRGYRLIASPEADAALRPAAR